MFIKYDSYTKEDGTFYIMVINDLQFEYKSIKSNPKLEEDFKMFAFIKSIDQMNYNFYQKLSIWLDDRPTLVEELNKINIYHKDVFKIEKVFVATLNKETNKKVKVKEENLYFKKKNMNEQKYMEYVYNIFDECYIRAYGYSVWDYLVDTNEKYIKMYNKYLDRQTKPTAKRYVLSAVEKEYVYEYKDLKFVYNSTYRKQDLEQDMKAFSMLYYAEKIDTFLMQNIISLIARNFKLKHRIYELYNLRTNASTDYLRKKLTERGVKQIYEDFDNLYIEINGYSVFDYMVN